MTQARGDGLKLWFPNLKRRSAAKLQLFCFPFAGGGASAFLRWQDHLPDWIEVWALEYPAHESRYREPAVADAHQLASMIAEQLAVAIEGPFALFGHSMGSLLAFEAARRLKANHGLSPETLFVSGFNAPQLTPHRPPVRDLPEPAFREELRRYGGTPEEILADEDFMGFVSPLLRNDLGLCETYVHQPATPLDYPIIAFGGYDDVIVPWHRLLAWSVLTSSQYVAHFMPGGHFFIKDGSPRMARMIGEYLGPESANHRLSPPDRDEVHLWTVSIKETEAKLGGLRALLSSDELARADAFVQQEDQARSVLARSALRDLLARYCSIDPKAITFSYSQEQKPTAPALRPLDFNVSHSGNYALIGIAHGQAIGVDIEALRPGVYTPSLIDEIATFDERRQLATIAKNEQEPAFFDIWVRKEASLKRDGRGFTGSPSTVQSGISARFRTETLPDRFAGGNTQSFTLAMDHAASVSADRPIALITIRVWQGGDE